VTPSIGDTFRIEGHRGMRWRCVELGEGTVTAYGGSMQPWGRQGWRTFRDTLPFVVVEEKQDA
jgi:hypothetical protein